MKTLPLMVNIKNYLTTDSLLLRITLPLTLKTQKYKPFCRWFTSMSCVPLPVNVYSPTALPNIEKICKVPVSPVFK